MALVIKELIIWESKCHQKSPPWCYLMAMWGMRKQKFIDQLSCKISEMMRYNCEICHGLSLCETLHFVLYSWSSYFAFFSQNYKNSKWPLNGHIEIVCSRKLIRSLPDIAEHICQIKKGSDGNFFLKRTNELFSLVAIVIKGLIWGSKYHQNNSPVACDSYVKYEEAEVDRLVAIWKTNNYDSGGGGPCVVQ